MPGAKAYDGFNCVNVVPRVSNQSTEHLNPITKLERNAKDLGFCKLKWNLVHRFGITI